MAFVLYLIGSGWVLTIYFYNEPFQDNYFENEASKYFISILVVLGLSSYFIAMFSDPGTRLKSLPEYLEDSGVPAK